MFLRQYERDILLSRYSKTGDSEIDLYTIFVITIAANVIVYIICRWLDNISLINAKQPPAPQVAVLVLDMNARTIHHFIINISCQIIKYNVLRNSPSSAVGLQYISMSQYMNESIELRLSPCVRFLKFSKLFILDLRIFAGFLSVLELTFHIYGIYILLGR